MAGVRIAVLADIHGNKPALDAVLADIERERTDGVYVLGDIVNGGPEPSLCWHTVRGRADGILRGNHERYVLSAAAGDPAFETDAWGPPRWTAEQLSASELEDLAALPPHIALDAGPASGTLLCHASPRRDDDLILPDTPLEDVRPMVRGASHATVVRAHNHVAFARHVAGIRILAIGAVGLAFGQPPRAEYALLTARGAGWAIEHRRIAYDVDATLRACRDTGYLAEGGPVARLFAAEIATGRRYLADFMRRYYDPAAHASLDEAVDAYLG